MLPDEIADQFIEQHRLPLGIKRALSKALDEMFWRGADVRMEQVRELERQLNQLLDIRDQGSG